MTMEFLAGNLLGALATQSIGVHAPLVIVLEATEFFAISDTVYSVDCSSDLYAFPL